MEITGLQEAARQFNDGADSLKTLIPVNGKGSRKGSQSTGAAAASRFYYGVRRSCINS